EDVKVTISESVEVTKTEVQIDGTIKEVSEEVQVKETLVDEVKKFDAIKLVNIIKENAKNRY
ncbi:hypothetical protein, partial [Cetobacterium sp.]|uniref:hypothetical protein n=1 Tax=Cetobacterium sp. TaxID=2071632 RepID=UPI003EE58855